MTLRALAEAATPGPWETGVWWGRAGVLPERFGEGRCAYCSDDRPPPVVVGRMDINGHKMLAHQHRLEGDAYYAQHEITNAVGARIAGNYGYEEGGIIHPADAAYIAAASPDAILALLDELDRLRAVRDAAADLPDDATDEDPEGIGGDWCHFCGLQTDYQRGKPVAVHEPWCSWAALRAALAAASE